MTKDTRAARIADLRAEFQRLIDFHAVSFRDIDDKAKYWLTITLPAFVALAGYLYQNGTQMGFPLIVAGYALAANLFVSTFLLSSALGSRRVESGILTPVNHDFLGVEYFLASAANWQSLQEDQTAEMLRAIRNNEVRNAEKSRWLQLGEASLFRGAPAAICVGGGCAFAYTTACPSGLGGIPIVTGTVAGIGVGLAVSAALVAFTHGTTSSGDITEK
jgi:hypothetical protein